MRRIFAFCCVLTAVCMSTEVSSLEEGSSCTNFDGTAGVCKVDRTCQWALDKLKSKEIKASQLVRCGLKGASSVICCKDDTIHPLAIHDTPSKHSPGSDIYFPGEENGAAEITTPMAIPSKIGMKLRKSEEACNLIKKLKPGGLDFHILNGEGADPGEFPHMTAIGYSAELDESKYTFDCGGSLISLNYVLTAGHCVNSRIRQPKVVRFGRVSLQEYTEDETDPNEAQLILVKNVILHPKYTSRKKYNDIALLEMAANVQYEKIVKPACLYSKSPTSTRTDELTISGWGVINTDTRERTSWLQKANIKELPLDECREIYKRLGFGSALSEGIIQSQICATSKTKDGKVIDACQGDSGGPIQFKIQFENEDVYYIVGVTSFGAACASEVPGVYTRVSEFLDWIEPIVWPGKVEI